MATKSLITALCCVACVTLMICCRRNLNLSFELSTDIVQEKQERVLRWKQQKEDDDPCSRPNPPIGGAAPLGVLYIVSGSPDYAEQAFVPVVKFLREEIGIPDASARDPNEPRWAIATEPHLCRGVLRDVIPFFDVVMTDFKLPIENPGFEKSDTLTARERFGAWQKGYRDYSHFQKHFVKAFKVTALGHAPFEKTIYLDADSIPCDRNFPYVLAETLGSADIALGPTQEHGYRIAPNKVKHWNTHPGGPDQHNSGCVIFNMKSERTRELLELWKKIFFTNKRKRPGFEQTHDQTPLGNALMKLYFNGGINHVDLDPHIFAHPHTMENLGLGTPKCDGTGDWLIIHKTNTITNENFMN